MKTLKLRSEREQVVELCQRMDADGLTVGTSGNISLRDPVTGLIAVSPSGLPYGEMTVEDVVDVDIEGNVVEGERKPSSETDMHRLVYVAQPEAGCVIHTHSRAATALACLEHDLPLIHPNLSCAAGSDLEAGVRCMPFMPSHTVEFGEAVVKTLGDTHALLLGHHGLIASGPDGAYAYNVASVVEFCADLYLSAQALGEPRALSVEESADTAGIFARARERAKANAERRKAAARS
ncbi:class II aldolase/adducin family protein [Olsenella uli]|uniref:class II aldolase/adducin family protein n=1 Tax=Olsenella uli TaxID=133926 RepID=UPI0012AC527F|nr:class II aldolase/adducin family protein [Olsenella uli]